MNLNDLSCEEIEKIKSNQQEEKAFRKSLSKLLSGDSQIASKPIMVGITPNAIDCCTEKKGLPLLITKKVIKKCMRVEIRDADGKQVKNSGHGLSEQQLNDIIWAFKCPVMVIKGTQENTLAVMTDLKDNEGRFIFVFVSLDKVGSTASINMITSTYGRNNINEYLRNCVKNNMILAINKEKVNAVRLSIGGHFSEATAPINFDNTIAYSLKSVKYNYTKSRCPNMKEIKTLKEALDKISELEKENANLKEELEYYKKRKASGRQKHNAKWMDIYNDFVDCYEKGMPLIEIANRNNISKRSIYRYKAYYEKISSKT